MPLAFESVNRGTIAFGFFNIDTDLLLLQQYFLFADDFCAHLVRLAGKKRQEPYETAWEVYSIDTPRDIGYLFTKEVFHRLIQYVWAGGYPRWKDEIRPAYVVEMKFRLGESSNWLTRGLIFP
jgi:hypothetical protein